MKITMMALLFALMLSSAVYAQQIPLLDERSKIAVTGEALVNVKPNKIMINLGIETHDMDIVVAKNGNNDIMRKALAVMKKLEVPEKDIQTDHLSIEPRWKNESRREDFLGYFVRNGIVVTLTDVEKVEELLTEVLVVGVNYVHSIDFQTTELKKYREQARELALRAAREKADKMAAVLNQLVGSPIQINESYTSSPWRYWSSWRGWGWGQYQGASQNAVYNVQDGPSETGDTISLGNISIRANVAVTFELKAQ